MLKRVLQGTVIACLLSGGAYAGDSSNGVVAPVAPAFTWTGFYAGTLTGYNFGGKRDVRTVGNTVGTQSDVASSLRPASVGIDQNGFASFGAGIGYDYQLAPGGGLVVGVAADGTWMHSEHHSGYFSPRPPLRRGAIIFPPTYSAFRQQLDWMATARGRVGYAFDRVLVYGTAGVAFGHVNDKVGFLRSLDDALAYGGRSDDTATGYVYGAGVEYAIPPDSILNRFNLLSYIPLFSTSGGITFKAEALHYDLGTQNVLVSPVTALGSTGSYTARFKTEGNMVRAGFTYRFSGP